MKGKGKLLTYWLLREENEQQEDQAKDGLPSQDLPTENGTRLPADWDTGGVYDAENCKQMKDVKVFPCTDSLADNLRGYETIVENVEECKKQDPKSGDATAEEFRFKSEDGLDTTANCTVQKQCTSLQCKTVKPGRVPRSAACTQYTAVLQKCIMDCLH